MIAGAPANNVQLPSMFQMPNMANAAGGAFSGIGNLGQYNLYNIPQASQITQGLVNNPYSGQFQAGANQAGGLGQLQALGQYGVGQNVTGMGLNQLAPYAGQVMGTAMDPQQALYNRTLQQVQDQTGAASAASGVGNTPYGASVMGNTLSNFNIDWQNQQLQRQIAGLGAAGGALGQAGSLAQLGQGLSAGAPGQYLQSSAIPYSTFGQIGQGQIGALSNLGQFGGAAAQIPGQQIQDYLAYLGAGNQAGGVANQLGQLGLNQSQLGFNQMLQYGNMLGSGLGNLGARGYSLGMPNFGGPASPAPNSYYSGTGF